MRCTSSYVSIRRILLHQLQLRGMMAPITRGMPNSLTGVYITDGNISKEAPLHVHVSRNLRGAHFLLSYLTIKCVHLRQKVVLHTFMK